MSLRLVDLFAGCGGLSLGFQKAGFDVAAAFEYWGAAADCYEKNFKHPVIRQDLSNVEDSIAAIKNFKPDLIIGGPPCQDFSSAGKRVEAKRASLTEDYARIVAAIKPKFFVMENVARAQLSKAYKEARKIFVEAGYGLTENVLDACLCGAPQKRKRFICIGMLGGQDNFVQDLIEKSLAKKPMTVRQYFGKSLEFDFYYRHPRSYVRRAVFSVDEPAPTMRGVNRPVPKGYPGHPNDAAKLDGTIRALTTLERAKIQTFPASYKWIGSKTDIEQMIGNAVPVNLGKFVATALKKYIETNDL